MKGRVTCRERGFLSCTLPFQSVSIASTASHHHLEQKINTRHCFSAIVSGDPFKSPIEIGIYFRFH
ncbi:hypothetical protein C1H46_007708 [Malus baccata]|uniref:Uncharacterized protein n=1 Tax=Malus baccata TaxID=106549 RepID=A0A540N6G6_MALBA|nr:hypothetical protein C1H46_007708 [Malus baccata]